MSARLASGDALLQPQPDLARAALSCGQVGVPGGDCRFLDQRRSWSSGLACLLVVLPVPSF